jgi:hypothetical protein
MTGTPIRSALAAAASLACASDPPCHACRSNTREMLLTFLGEIAGPQRETPAERAKRRKMMLEYGPMVAAAVLRAELVEQGADA